MNTAADFINVKQFANWGGITRAIRRAVTHLVPPPDILPSEFAERNIDIPIGNAVPGPIRFDAAFYQKGMIDVIKEPGINRVSYMLGAQLGKTTIQQCITAYFIAHDPRSQIWLMPSEGDMLTFRSTKLSPMLDANPRIAKLMAKPRGREGQNNSRMISFIGGWLMFSWSGSAKTLRGRSAPVTLADEIDGMENAGTAEKDEGDPVQLLMQRAASFSSSGQNIHIESSTPTIKGHSRIESAHDAGDMRKFWIPCQHCGETQVLKWENVTWQGRQIDVDADMAFKQHEPDTAAYMCDHCGVAWSDGDRVAAVRNGKWIASKPTKGHASFHLSELYSPFRKLRDIVQSYLDKLAVDSYNTFVNVSLAKTFEGTVEQVDPTGLMSRATPFAAQVPMGGLYLTAGIDMQTDRLECEIVAWGEGEESWSVGYYVLWGDPLVGDVWDDLDDLLAETFVHESGAVLPVSAACLDTGGTSGYTQRAYEYLRGKSGRRLFGIKGLGGWGRPIVEKMLRKQSGKNARKVDLFGVGVDEAKLIVMRRLANDRPGSPGYCNIPKDRDQLGEWCKQITAEKMKIRYVKGQPVREWHKPDRARNEALDCRVYALAALKIMQPSMRRMAAKLAVRPRADPGAAQIARPIREPAKAAAAVAPPTEKPQEAQPKPKPQTARIIKSPAARRTNWVNSWKK
ncbi:MAG TPA: terminase gpA endonuclease subunit [Pyrinomonadaceae bacterium]|nr:terminase gpA endonuclease subunit [Pyrinomonadaceae bacterium]